ncbi:MAG: prepilin-type cleavage/methylation domain-containing protein, partial [Gammaproteobacteria bacterium]
GLLLGGILKGQELITQGRIRNVANDFQSMTAAINLYQDRYRALPGDDASAGTRWATAGTATTSGGGNGVIAGTYNSATNTDESRLFWHHLRHAGLVGGSTTTGDVGTANPPNAANGITGVQNGAFGISGIVVCSNNLSATIAQAIDTQFDDGQSSTGTVRAATGTDASVAAAANYVDDGSSTYVVCKAP